MIGTEAFADQQPGILPDLEPGAMGEMPHLRLQRVGKEGRVRARPP
ncbi:hypothetical protein [Falsiroseomonas sp.]